MNIRRLIIIPFFLLLFLSFSSYLRAQSLSPIDIEYMTIPQLEKQIEYEQTRINSCKEDAYQTLTYMSAKETSNRELEWLEENIECMKTHKANILLIKKEILKRLGGMATDDPDRKKLKKAQGDANKAVKDAQSAMTDIKKERDAQTKTEDTNKK